MVLYNKYRPTTFSEVISQNHITNTLKNEIIANKIAHAYIFAGPKGSGKTTIARIFAKAINCLNPKNGEPCNKCRACKAINSNKTLDLIEIDAASHGLVDDVRELNQGAKFSPNSLKYKVFIIDEAHQMSKQAFNALLKTLEEPPAHTIFILATTEAYKIIPTIISRCQRFDFKKLGIQEIINLLKKISKKENIDITTDSLRIIASFASGDLRDAISLLDKLISSGYKKITLQKTQSILGIPDLQYIIEFINLISQKHTKKALKLINDLVISGLDMHQYVKSLIDYFRKLTIIKIDNSLSNLVAPDLTKEQLEVMLKQSKRFTNQKLVTILNSLLDASSKMKYSPFTQLPLEMAVVELTL